jgi:trimeric autotransporter adhesin
MKFIASGCLLETPETGRKNSGLFCDVCELKSCCNLTVSETMRIKIFFRQTAIGIIMTMLAGANTGCFDMVTPDSSSSGSSTGLTNAPTVPLPLTPANGMQSVVIPPTLVWQYISSATGYTVQVATDNLFKNIVTTKNLSAVSTVVVIGLINNTKYYWRVCSKNSTGSSNYSTAYSFTTVNMTPLLLSPYNGATAQSKMPVLVWEKVTGAVSYTVEVSSNSTFSSIIVTRSGVISTTLLVTGLLANTTYYWRVRAQFASSTSNNSNTFHFTTGS